MKYYYFHCPKCKVAADFSSWNKETKKFMIDKKMNIKTFKSIRESVGQFNRNYVCPCCSAISSMREIKHSN